MANHPVSLRIPEEVRAIIEDTAKRTKRDFSSVANEMLEEAVKSRRVPGIIFVDGINGRVARVAGTGLEVWEIARDYHDLGANWERLRTAYHWLQEPQLRSALAYAEAYPEEVEARIRRDEQRAPEDFWAAYPFTRPPGA